MKSFDGAFVTALLVTTLVTPVVTEPFCKTPSESEAYRANTPVVSQWRNGHFSVEVTIPKRHLTAHIDSYVIDFHNVLLDGWNSNDYISFNGSNVLQKRFALSDYHQLRNDFVYNITGKTCTSSNNDKYEEPLFSSTIGFVSLIRLYEELVTRRQFSSRLEYVDSKSSVRGEDVSHWKFCYDEKFLLQFFSDSRGTIGRVVITGEDIPEINYDILTLDNDSSRRLKFPRGVVCEGSRYIVPRKPPSEFESFSATTVMVYTTFQFSTTRKEFYCNDVKLASSVVFILPGTPFERRFGHGYIRVVRDYNTDVRYIIDVKRGNCTIESMEHARSSYLFTGPWDPAQINVRKSPGLFDLHNFQFTYQETTEQRGQEVNVFKAMRRDWPYYGVNTTAEVYYTTDRWVTDGMPITDAMRFEGKQDNIDTSRSKLFGFWYETTATETSSLDGLIPEMTHVLQYKDGVDDFSVFDISACYDQRKQTKTVVFSLPGCYGGIIRTRTDLLENALRKYIVRETGIDVIRVGEIEIVISSPSVVDLWVTLFDIPQVKGKLSPAVSLITLDMAVTRLTHAVDDVPSRPLVVAYPEGDQPLTFIRGSLRFGETAKLSVTKGHSAITMGAVLVATGVTGLALGLMVYIILWKKAQTSFLVQ